MSPSSWNPTWQPRSDAGKHSLRARLQRLTDAGTDQPKTLLPPFRISSPTRRYCSTSEIVRRSSSRGSRRATSPNGPARSPISSNPSSTSVVEFGALHRQASIGLGAGALLIWVFVGLTRRSAPRRRAAPAGAVQPKGFAAEPGPTAQPPPVPREPRNHARLWSKHGTSHCISRKLAVQAVRPVSSEWT